MATKSITVVNRRLARISAMASTSCAPATDRAADDGSPAAFANKYSCHQSADIGFPPWPGQLRGARQRTSAGATRFESCHRSR